MNFERVFTFLLKRMEEIGFKEAEAEELRRLLHKISVKYHWTYLSSGLVIDKEYKDYGFKE